MAIGEEGVPFVVISAFICLGRKYDIQKLYVEAEKRIFRTIPAKLADYDALPEKSFLITAFTYLDFAILGRKSGLFSLLPYAFYQSCYLYSTAGITNGLKASDGHKAALHLHDQVVCLGGYRAGCETQADTTYAWIHNTGSVAPNCTTPKVCQRAKRAHNLTHFDSGTALDGLGRWSACAPLGLCSECFEEGRSRHEAGRRQFWEKLPGIFNLPPWTELLKERQEMCV